MKQVHKKLVVLMLCMFGLLFGQVPTLDPSQTVNPATGEMGFSLPLGVVGGLNGNDYQINLNYQAGIRLHQQASEVGLGFSYMPGSITRKVVFVQDDASGNEKFSTKDWDVCKGPKWIETLNTIIFFVSLVISTIATILTDGGAAPILAAVLTFGANAVSMASMIVILVCYSPANFTAGGTHLPTYQADFGRGVGFNHGKNIYDLPDVYFINSPYINGEFSRVGGEDNGYYRLVNTSGSADIDKSTIIIEKSSSNDFIVTLNNGTKLYFEKKESMCHNHFSDGHRSSDGTVCDWHTLVDQKESLPTQWYLTKVTFSNFKDGSIPEDNDPTNSSNTNSGAWIAFQYDSIIGNFSRPINYLQESEWSTGTDFYYGSVAEPVRLFYLTKAITPTGSAAYNYGSSEEFVGSFWNWKFSKLVI